MYATDTLPSVVTSRANECKAVEEDMPLPGLESLCSLNVTE